MTDKERLVEVLKTAREKYDYYDCTQEEALELLAQHLLDNGVTPCKVGQTVYYFSHRPFNLSVQANTVYEAIVVRIVTTRLGTQLVIQIRNEYGCTEVPDIRSWGKTVFTSREEAEKALEEGGEE